MRCDYERGEKEKTLKLDAAIAANYCTDGHEGEFDVSQWVGAWGA